jgi:hypothetical protein
VCILKASGEEYFVKIILNKGRMKRTVLRNNEDERIQTKAELIERYKNLEAKTQKEKREILDDLKTRKELKVKDNIKEKSNLCVILSCPGEEELIEQKVCAGETGENLEYILSSVSKQISLIPPYDFELNPPVAQRYNYTIINSVDDVYFRKYNDSEAEKEEIEKEANVKRVQCAIEKLKHLKYILICGDNANIIYQKIKASHSTEVKTAKVCHLGWVGLRNEYKNCHKDLKSISSGKERDEKRLQLLADKIIDNLKK